jgi:hypothetical protein
LVHGRPGHKLNRDYYATTTAHATTTYSTSAAASATTTTASFASFASATTTSTAFFASFASFAAASAADADYTNGLGIGGNGNGWSTTAIFWTHVVVICIDIVGCTGVNYWNGVSFDCVSKLVHGRRTHAFNAAGKILPTHV